jgi:uncharacterized protein with FMN-binding domain
MLATRNRSARAAASATLAVATMTGATAALVATVVSASGAAADPAPGQDPYNDWGRTPAQIAAMIKSQVNADPAVVSAHTKYRSAVQAVAARQAALAKAIKAHKHALKTRGKVDDRRTAHAVTQSKAALARAKKAAAKAKANWDAAVTEATTRITAQHYTLAPTNTASPTDTSTTSVPSPSDTSTTSVPSPSDTSTTSVPSPSDTSTTSVPTPTDTATTPPPPPPINGVFQGIVSKKNPYGDVQVQITVVDNVITAVTTPLYPKTGDSKAINNHAVPILQTEAVAAQSSVIAAVSGASYTSKAFKESLQSAIVLAGL